VRGEYQLLVSRDVAQRERGMKWRKIFEENEPIKL
jgi:hypothetical protein